MGSAALSLAILTATSTTYDASRAQLESQREQLLTAHRSAKTEAQRNTILDHAAQLVLQSLTGDLAPAWYGTRWSYNGTSDQPREGSIACGFFVATLLRDAGFQLDRIKLGRLASEAITKTLTAERNIRRYSDRPSEAVVAELAAWGPGLYAVGLDFHAGLAWIDGDRRAWFIHATVLGEGVALIEPLGGDGSPFVSSRYRVVGRLLDRPMMRRWLYGERFD